jgi:hypothetical protein
MKCQSVIAIFAALVATYFAMDQPSFHTKGTPTGKPTDPLKPSEYWWKAGRWMRVDGEARSVDAEKLASRLRFSPEFAHKVADEIASGTTVIVTDVPAVRKPVNDSTYFASN